MAFPCMNRAADLLKKDVAQAMLNIFWGHNPPFDSCHMAHLRWTYGHQDAMCTVHQSSFCHGRLPRSPPYSCQANANGNGQMHMNYTPNMSHTVLSTPKRSQRNKSSNIWKIMCQKKCARFYGYIFFVLVCIFCVPNLGLSTFSVPKEGLGYIYIYI